MSSPDAELRGGVEQLETDHDRLYATFRAVDGEFHEAIARHRADRSLMGALRTTQIEQGQILGELVVQVSDLMSDVTEQQRRDRAQGRAAQDRRHVASRAQRPG